MSEDPHDLAERLNKLALSHLSDDQMEEYLAAMMQGSAWLRVTYDKDGAMSVDLIKPEDLQLWT